MSWIILNANNKKWGHEIYETPEAAAKELKDFFRGISNVDFKKFRIVPAPAKL